MIPLFAVVAVVLAFLTGRTCQAQAVLRPGDTVEIRLAGVPTDEINAFSAAQCIDEGGMLNLAYIGKLKVAGLDSSEAQHLIENKLKSEKIFTNPTITIKTQANTQLVNITGDVKNAGRLNYTADLTVMTAIAGAGGFTDFADKKHVKLVRGGTVQVLDTTKFSKDPSLDVKVLPGDQVFVPQSNGLW